MSSTPKLDTYLNRMEAALSRISVTERAGIITEIASHVAEAQERNPTQTVDEILRNLGDPEAVAYRYISERGIKPGKRPRPQIMKWLAFGFLGTVGMILIAFFVLIWKFSPLIKVDGDKGSVEILGGTIQIMGDTDEMGRTPGNSFRIDSAQRGAGPGLVVQTLSGSEEQSGPAPDVQIITTNGKLVLETSRDNKTSWDCKIGGMRPDAFPRKENGKLVFDLADTKFSKCEFQIPKGAHVNAAAQNGKLVLEKPLFHLEANLTNGKIAIEQAKGAHYKYETQVTNGKVADLKSSNDPQSFAMKLKLTNGNIDFDTEDDSDDLAD